MLHMPAMRVFILHPEGVRCGADGLYVGSVPLLRRARDSCGREHWSPRPATELDNELTARYGLPISVIAKANGLASVARALDRGDLALAGIGAVLLQFPDPPPLEKGALAANDWTRLAAELACSGLLKGDWDPAKHPRTGQKPNPGWFADVVREVREVTARMRAWPSPRFNKALRVLVKGVAEKGGTLRVRTVCRCGRNHLGTCGATRAVGTPQRRRPRDRADQRLFRSAQDAGGASDAADAKRSRL